MKKCFLYTTAFLLQLIVNSRAGGQVTEEFNELIYFIPAGLTVVKTPNSMVLSDGESYTITVNRSFYSLKKIERSFPAYWRESLLNDGVDNPDAEPKFVKAQTNSGWSWYRGGKTISYHEKMPSFYYHLTVMRYLGITTLITTRAGSEDLFMQKYPQLMQLISSVVFKPAQPVNQQRPPAANQRPE